MNLKLLDHNRKFMLSALPIALSLVIYLLILNPANFFVYEWFLNFLSIPAFIGMLVASAGDVGRSIDVISSKSVAGPAERFGTVLGLICGLCLGIGLFLLGKAIPFMDALHSLATVIFTLNNIGMCIGLGGRLGSFVDQNTRPKLEKQAMVVMATIGFIAGLALFFTQNAALISITGIATFFTGGVALPVVLCGIIFSITFSSLCAASADFFSKTGSFLRASFTKDLEVQNTVKEKFHEYRGAAIGSGIALVVSAIIITALAITQPHIFVGFVGIAIAAVIIMTAENVISGFFSRMGKLVATNQTEKLPEQGEDRPLLDLKIDSTLTLPTPQVTAIKPELDVTLQNEVRDQCSANILTKKTAVFYTSNSCLREAQASIEPSPTPVEVLRVN